MATGGNSMPAETLDCPLCFEQFRIPRILPCLHTVCERCLDRHIKQQSENTYCCPICNTKVAPRDAKISKGKLASSFPLHLIMQSLIDVQNKRYDDNNFCVPCRDEKKVLATFWCDKCKKKLCDFCYNNHKRKKQLKQHKTVQLKEKDYIHSNVTFEQNCVHHPDYKLKAFCLIHRALCCIICFSTFHRDCGDIREINSAAEDQAKRCNYREIKKQISQIQTEMDKILTDKMDNRSQIKTEKEQIIHSMDVRIEQLIKNLNALRISFKNETEKLYQETNNYIVKIEKQIKSFQTSIANCRQIIESLEQKTSSREKFIVFETVRSQVTSHFEQLKSSTQDDVEIDFSLKANAALRDIEELSSIGIVQIVSKQPESIKNGMKTVDDIMEKLSTMSKLSTPLSAAQIAKPMTSRVTFLKTMTKQNYGDDTRFTGGTVLRDGRLLMADYNNKRLVQLDEDYNMVKQYKVDGLPRDVAAGRTDKEIYVTVWKGVGEFYVYKCRLGTGLKVVRRIKAPFCTCGIAVSDDYIIVGSLDAVVVLNQDGTTVNSIPTSGDVCYVAVSQKQRAMYYRDDEAVVCRTLEGRELYRYGHPQLETPRGICTDTHGRAYICGRVSHNVHQVSPDGITSTILELHTISRPRCCVFLPQRNQLVVTSYSGDTALEVYKLE